jgi:hypothetical protein
MKVDSLVDGKEMMLDWKTHTLVPRIVVSVGDRVIDMEPFTTSLDPQEVLERSKKIIAAYGLSKPNELTVDDLSIVTAEKKKRDARHPRGDSRERGLSVGSLYEGPEVPKSAVNPSQEVLMEMQRKQREKREEVSRMKALIRKQQEGPVSPGETAAILRGET